MAFDSAVSYKTTFGNRRVHYGTWTGGSTTGGDVDTGLRLCETIQLVVHASAVGTNAPAVNESFPVAGSAVTIVHDSDQDGYWVAYGY